MTPTRPVLRYHGGKWKLAPWVISHFPPHRIYVEPYGGAASVLLRKPRCYAEVYNDLDGAVVNVFRVLRDPAAASALAEKISLTPFSREEFESASNMDTDDPVEMARRTIARSFFGFGSGSYNAEYVTGFRRKSFRSGTAPSWDWHNYPEAIPAFVERMRGVTVENSPALEVLLGNDRQDVLFYVDPPYVASTRCRDANGGVYRHEMTDADHEEMAAVLLRLEGMVVLSGYDCPLYRRIFAGWTMKRRESFADGASPRTECLWINPNAVARSLPMLEAMA